MCTMPTTTTVSAILKEVYEPQFPPDLELHFYPISEVNEYDLEGNYIGYHYEAILYQNIFARISLTPAVAESTDPTLLAQALDFEITTVRRDLAALYRSYADALEATS